ncbi:MAG: MlaE family lipid ABC transporter permease subunit [Myxococcales bacterium]|nr:MlaE family lipid ABC transporter permease subunit [Myxococcales bacterium]
MSTGLRFRIDGEGSASVLRLSGPLRRDVVGELAGLLVKQAPRAGQSLDLDLSAVEAMDSAAVAALVGALRRAQGTGAQVRVTAVSEPARRALAMFRVDALPDPPAAPPGAIEALGGGLINSGAGFVDFLQLAADSTFAVLGALRHPRKLRFGALIEQAIDIGSRALGIVGLITFLVGLTVAFQSAHQLRQFGAAIFVADLTAVSMVREMAPLMTAILVAGRSGSSIAAEIATMQVSEEIDALTVMGLDPIHFLALPRLLAITLMVPLLTVLSDLLGMLGGFLVGVVYLDIAWNAFLNQMLDALAPWDLISGLVKSLAFAYGIGLIGLYYGFRVRGGASEVGRTTTASVVASIFYIIVADCLFSVLFYIVL